MAKSTFLPEQSDLLAASHVACGDCERIRPGLVAQPANTLSSLAYIVAGMIIARRAHRDGGRFKRHRLAVAVAAVATGAGSVAYHGPGGRCSKRLHDGALVALGLAVAARKRAGQALSPAASGVVAAASVIHAASRTGRPLCNPNSRFQGHALWHLATAIALVIDDRA